jgi:Protein of unknown function (DUF4242)
MGKYVVELYFPHGNSDALTSAVDRARSAAGWPAQDGSRVTYVRSLFLPADELCFLLYDAPSAEAVLEVARRAEITFERIVEAEVDEGGD